LNQRRQARLNLLEPYLNLIEPAPSGAIEPF